MTATREDLTAALWDALMGATDRAEFVFQLENRLTRIGWYDPEIADIAHRLAQLKAAPAGGEDGFADERVDEDEDGPPTTFVRLDLIEERLCKLEAGTAPAPHICQCNRSKA